MTLDDKRLLEQQNALFKSGLLKDCESCRAEQEFCEDAVSREDVISEIHNTIFTFFDICEDDEETPMNDKDKLLLKVNKAICNNVKSMKPVTPMLLSSCEDAVSRFEAYEALNSINGGAELDKAFEAIENLPPVTPTRKKNKWIEVWDKDHLVVLAYKCSECGMMMNVNTSHYCPSCGCRMKGENE